MKVLLSVPTRDTRQLARRGITVVALLSLGYGLTIFLGVKVNQARGAAELAQKLRLEAASRPRIIR